jgi:hypothetical protein
MLFATRVSLEDSSPLLVGLRGLDYLEEFHLLQCVKRTLQTYIMLQSKKKIEYVDGQ